MTSVPMTNPKAPSKTQSSVADTDPNSIEAFATRLMSSGFVVAERGRDARPPTQQEAMLIAHAARKYDLDPLMGEVSVLGAKLYTNLPGVRKSARKQVAQAGRRYSERTRPATREEYEAAACAEKEHYWICEVIIDGGEDVFIGHGFASAENVAIAAMWRDRQLVGHDTRIIRNMAENRAVRRALVAAFGLPFADSEDGEREGPPQVPATVTAAPTSGQQSVYPAIPSPTAAVAIPVVEQEPAPERARTTPTTYPERPAAKGRTAKTTAQPSTAETMAEIQGAMSATANEMTTLEKAEILRREREEFEREAAARDRARGD